MMNRSDLQIDKLLDLSVKQYRELLQHAEKMMQMLDACDYSQIDERAVQLQQLQTVATQQDEQLLPLLKSDLINWKEDKRFQMRMDYINSILKLNELLVPKIKSIMAVTSAELKKIHSGRTALAGYASQTKKQHGLRGIG